ncbi:MAG TPA: hypothetical protein VG142_03835 [Trebonia sp.]|jgi:hypothetical protein|nr:hypothetical protein [Trebonia sp.]
MNEDNEAQGQQTALKLQGRHPMWAIHYGTWTGQYIALPKFLNASMITAESPEVLEEKLANAEKGAI